MNTVNAEMFIAADGDDVGSRIELFILKGQMAELKEYSEKFNSSIDWLIDMLIAEFNATIYLKGGDSILVGMLNAAEIYNLIENLRQQFSQKSGNSLSVGIGHSPLDAYLALKYAKASGKNCIRLYSDLNNNHS